MSVLHLRVLVAFFSLSLILLNSLGLGLNSFLNPTTATLPLLLQTQSNSQNLSMPLGYNRPNIVCSPDSPSYIELIIGMAYRDWKGALGEALSAITNAGSANNKSAYHQNFTNGAIYWTPLTGVHEVHGKIYQKWRDLGLERSFLGYPITDERPTPYKDSNFNIFENGAIYWTPLTGVHEVHGKIYQKWRDLGLERSFLGYPITDERQLPDGGSVSYFQGGSIQWTNESGAFAVHSKDYLNHFESRGLQVPKTNLPENAQTISGDIALEAVVKDGLDFPTSVAFLSPNEFLVLEKEKGTVKKVVDGALQNYSLLDVNVASRGERGMLGMAVAKSIDQGFPKTFVFLYFTESRTKDTSNICEEMVEKEVLGNRLYRYELSENGTKLINPKLLLSLPDTLSAQHMAGKMIVGLDGYLYMIVGDLRTPVTTSQNNNQYEANGTSVIYRIDYDGLPAPGNPFGNGTSVSKFYAYGIRNSFGLAIDPVTGYLWDTENGEDNYDEINVIRPGFNSGWSKIQGLAKNSPSFQPDEDLINYLSSSATSEGNYRDPEFVWNITVGVSALQFFNSSKLGERYKDDLFVADITTSNLYHFKMNPQRTGFQMPVSLLDKIANTPSEAETLSVLRGYGSITDIRIGPDGYLYLAAIKSYYPTIDGQGIIYRVIPRS
jgi:glucose/arabinose dehydrogenase